MSPPLGCYVLKDRDSVLLTSNSHNLVGCCLVTKLCLTLCDPVDCSPPCSSAHAISQARILECVAIAFSRGSSQPRHQTHISCIGRWILHHEMCWFSYLSLKNLFPQKFPCPDFYRKANLCPNIILLSKSFLIICKIQFCKNYFFVIKLQNFITWLYCCYSQKHYHNGLCHKCYV